MKFVAFMAGSRFVFVLRFLQISAEMFPNTKTLFSERF